MSKNLQKRVSIKYMSFISTSLALTGPLLLREFTIADTSND